MEADDAEHNGFHLTSVLKKPRKCPQEKSLSGSALLFEAVQSYRALRRAVQSLLGNCGRRHVENTVSARIINGTEAEPGSWPWMVGLYNENDTLYCGGVLISDRFVLTAAHCLPNKIPSLPTVRIGSTKISNSTECPGETTLLHAAERSDKPVGNAAPNGPAVCAEVQEFCVPVQNCSFFMEDIVILKLKRPVHFTDHIQPICLPENCDEPSLNAATYIAGWGLVEDVEIIDYSEFEDYEENITDKEGIGSTTTEEPVVSVFTKKTLTLKQRNITLIDKTACENQLHTTVPDYIMCSTEGTCSGDSGGPLVYENNGTWFLVGIHSGGDKDCYNPKGPGVHIKVSYYISKLIKPFMKLGNSTDAKINYMCTTEEERVQCVTKLYASYNESLKYD